MPRFLQGTESSAELDPQAKGSQSYWYAKAELVEMQRRIKEIESTEKPSFEHRNWLSRAKQAEITARDALNGDVDGDYWGTYEMLKKVNSDWPGPP